MGEKSMRVKTTIHYCDDCGTIAVHEQRVASEMNLIGHSFVLDKCRCGKMMENLIIMGSESLSAKHRLQLIEAAQTIKPIKI
jgi:hypothetical protein